MRALRIESTVSSVSWIPSEAIKGLTRLPFDLGVTHYDDPPPELIDESFLEERARYRFANILRAFIEVEDGRIIAHGQEGGGRIGVTRVKLTWKDTIFPTFAFPDVRLEPEVTADRVRFVQTAGGRTSLPAPRTVPRPPYVAMQPPLAWTTLALTLYADGRQEFDLQGASSFPRHWVYDQSGKLAAKSGLVDFKTWYKKVFDEISPWGSGDFPAVMTEAESVLEREISRRVMKTSGKLERRRLAEGEALVTQGEEGRDVFLLLDGILGVEVDGERLVEIGPGALLGERALLEGGRRTSTLRATTKALVVVLPADQIDRDELREVAAGHRREDD